MQLYPEIYKCIGCNACTKACTQDLKVMQYIAHAQRGEYGKCAELSFDCVMCGACSARCPAEISHPQVAVLARRLTGKYIAPEAKHLTQRVKDIEHGNFTQLLEDVAAKPIEELKELYNHREIESDQTAPTDEEIKEAGNMFTPEMLASAKKVEATRAQRIGMEPKRMTAEEKHNLLREFHPDYKTDGFENLENRSQ